MNGRTTCAKIMITTGRDCGSAEWINKRNFIFQIHSRVLNCMFKSSQVMREKILSISIIFNQAIYTIFARISWSIKILTFLHCHINKKQISQLLSNRKVK